MSCAQSLHQGVAANVKKARKPVRNMFARTAESDITFCGPKKPVYLAACFVLPHALKVFV
jgi:hypothetical protein